MESMVQVAKGETAPFWTEERHVHFLNTMEASFVRTMLHRNGGDYYSGRWQLLRLDRHLPDSSESTLDSEGSRNSKMKKKHEASSPSDSLLIGPRSRTEKRRSMRRRRRSSQLRISSMEEQVVPEIENGGAEDTAFVGEHHKH